MSNVQVCILSYALSNLLLILLSIFFHFRCTFYPYQFTWVFFTSSISLVNVLCLSSDFLHMWNIVMITQLMVLSLNSTITIILGSFLTVAFALYFGLYFFFNTF